LWPLCYRYVRHLFACAAPETARQVSGHLFRSVHIFAVVLQTAHQERRIDG
jgi:hypothetical protein